MSGVAQDAFERRFDGAEPSDRATFGDVGWSLAERPDGGFLIVGEHLLDEKIDSHNRQAVIIVTDAAGHPQQRRPIPGFTHASSIRPMPDGSFVIAGNKKRNGASLHIVNADGDTLRERTKIVRSRKDKPRPNAAIDATPTPDGGLLVACLEGMRGFVTKLDAELQTDWSTAAITNLHYIKSAVQLPNGDCFMVGQHGGGKGVHIAQWNRDGAFVREVVHRPDASVNKGRRILLNQAGNLAITGMLGSGGRGAFLFMELDPKNIGTPLVTARVDMKGKASNYGQAMIQCKDGSYVIAGRSAQDRSHFLSLVRIDGSGTILAGPKLFGSDDPDSGEAGYKVIECRDGSLAVIGIAGTALLDGGKITDVSPSADFYLVKTRL